jgi:hypothetical protein
MNMVSYWFGRLNDFLAWLNPVLCFVACVLAVLVTAVAGERLNGKAAGPTIQTVQPINAPSSAECPRVALPSELRDLSLYD